MAMQCFSLYALLLHIFFIFTNVVNTQHNEGTTTVGKTTTITKTVAYDTATSTLGNSDSHTSSHAMPQRSYSGSEFQSAVLNRTNFFREKFLASPVSWDDTLANFAYNHARACIWEHSGGPYGENLAEGFETPALAVDAWAAEERHYSFPDGGFSESTGHFTQLVWQNTTHVGCGAVNCGASSGGDAAFGWYLVCEYSPPGNVEGEYRYNVLKPGESRDGVPGFGASSAGSRSNPLAGMLSVLVAVSWLAAMWL